MDLARIVLLISFTLLIGACAISSTIEEGNNGKSQFDKALIYNGERKQIQPPLAGIDIHRIFHQGSTGFTPVSALRRSAMDRLAEFCKLKGQKPYLIEETTSRPPHILGNWPRIEIVFSCVAAESRQEGSTDNQDKYDRLRKLKLLLDDGAVSHEEYEREKQKLLAQ